MYFFKEKVDSNVSDYTFIAIGKRCASVTHVKGVMSLEYNATSAGITFIIFNQDYHIWLPFFLAAALTSCYGLSINASGDVLILL